MPITTIAEIAAKVSEKTSEFSAINVIEKAKDMVRDIWPEVNDDASLTEVQDTPEAIANEAWEVTTSEEGFGKGTIDNPRYIIARNESLENDVHPITGVEFVRKTVQLKDEVIEGVFPKFKSEFDAQLPENLLLDTDKRQFSECNRQLASAIENDPELRAKFTEEQIEQIYEGIDDGSAPDGYVWNHNEEVGLMQLVDAETHARTGHTGGKCIWGGGKEWR